MTIAEIKELRIELAKELGREPTIFDMVTARVGIEQEKKSAEK